MSEWQNKSDSYINKAVVELINKINDDGSDFENTFAQARVYELEKGYFDPCNNWSDGGPIIVENEIGINKLKCEHAWLASDNNGIYSRDKNPLRAAMIVYLEMKGVKP